MARLQACLNCGETFDAKRTGVWRCSKCQLLFAIDRAEESPWSRLYVTREWEAVRRSVRRRDGFRCTWRTPDGRCPHKKKLSVHHLRKVRELWHDAANWTEFLRVATDPANLTTLCPEHHALADARVPRETAERRPKRHTFKKIEEAFTEATHDRRTEWRNEE